MEELIDDNLRAAGDELVENHGEEVIDAVIDDVEDLDSEDSDKTADLLRKMTGRTAE